MTLTPVDGLIIALIAISTVIGLFRGLFREVFSLALWTGALFVAYFVGPTFEPTLLPHVGSALARPAAFGILFVCVLIIGALVVRMMAALISSTGLSGTDRLLGMLFGALRGAVVAIVLLIALRGLFGEELWWQNASTIAFLLAFEHYVLEGLRAAVVWVSALFGQSG